MPLIIREADLNTDRELLIAIQARYLSPLINAERYDWLYLRNPFGKAQAWVAIDSCDNTLVGAAAAFPRLMCVNGCEKLVWVLGDFCINDKYRTLGPALQLQRMCLESLRLAKTSFCYDFPSQHMMAVYKRLQHGSCIDILRMTLALRVDRKVREIIKRPLLTKGISRVGNFLLNTYNRIGKVNEAADLILHKGSCGEEFSTLAQQVRRQNVIDIKRSAAYLNWRYLDHPSCCYQMMTAYVEGALSAYAVFTDNGADATLMDLFGVENPKVITAVVLQIINYLHRRGVATVNISMSQSHPWIGLIRHLGFKIRERAPVVICTPAVNQSNYKMPQELHWCLMQGDRES